MKMWKSRYTLRLLLISTLFIAGLTSLLSMIQAGERSAPLQQTVVAVAGTYSGNVTVSEPVPLGALTLVLGVSNNNGALSGEVDPTQTMVFLGGPSFTGSITAGAGITPTFHIESETFTREVSGRAVQRKFSLHGEVLNNGNSLKGIYEETITGFTPASMIVRGTFLLTRPFDSEIIIPPQIGVPTPTPYVPPVVTPPNPDEDGTTLKLPMIKNNVPESTSQENASLESASPETPPQATPAHRLHLPMTKGG